MITTAGIIVALCLWLTGLGLLELAEFAAGATRRRRCLAERHGVGLLLGMAFLPTLYAVVGIVFVDGPIGHAAGRWLARGPALVGLLLYLYGVSRRWRDGSIQRAWQSTATTAQSLAQRPWRAGLVGAALLAIVFFALFSIFYAGSVPMHLFDSLYHFAYKGKVLFAEGFGGSGWMVPSPEMELGSGVGRLMTHPNYPPGVAALHCLVASQLGFFEEDATRPLMALYVIGCAGAIWAFTVRRSIAAACVATLTWVSLPFLYYSKTWYQFIDWPVIEGGEKRYLRALSVDFGELAQSLAASWVGQRDTLTWLGLPTGFTRNAKMPDGWMLDGAADLQQGVLFCLGAVLAWRCLVSARESWDRADALAAGMLLSGATYVKNEGLALTAVAAAVFGAVWMLDLWRSRVRAESRRLARRALFGLATAFGIAFVMLVPWLSIRGDIPSVDEDYPTAIKIVFGLAEAPANISADQPQSVAEAAARVPIVATGFAAAFANVLRWNTVWVLFFVAIATWLVTRPKRMLFHPQAPLVVIAIGTLCAYGIILVVTPWDLAILYSTAIPDRLLLHLVPIVILTSTALVWRYPHEWNGDALMTDGPGGSQSPVANTTTEATVP